MCARASACLAAAVARGEAGRMEAPGEAGKPGLGRVWSTSTASPLVADKPNARQADLATVDAGEVLTKEAQMLEQTTPLIGPIHGFVEETHSPSAEEEGGIPIPTSGLLQVAERRQPLSSVSSLEVHFDLLDLTELTDMSDQELAEVFADSDDENVASEPPAGLQPSPHPMPRAGYLRSPSWTKSKADQRREKKHLSDSELQTSQAEPFQNTEKPKEE